MQRILNNPDNIVEEMLEGFLKAHPDLVEATDNPRAVKSVYPTQGRVRSEERRVGKECRL